MLAINFILLILTDILILVEEIRLDLELASNFFDFFIKSFNNEFSFFEESRHDLILYLSKML